MPDGPSVLDWFGEWIAYHQRLHPNKRWKDFKAADGLEFYQGWIQALANIGATLELSREASRSMQAARVMFDRHLELVLEAIRVERRRKLISTRVEVASDRGFIEAEKRSTGCPECCASGWAVRFARWHSIRQPFRVALFCRCPLGRWRKLNDPEPTRGECRRQHDDLQARPELWDLALSHPTWSPYPCDHDLVIDDDCKGLWGYVSAGPEPLQPRELARGLVRPF